MEDYSDDDKKEDQAALRQLKERMKVQEVCAFHKNMQATYFCFDVDKPVCAECFRKNTNWEVKVIAMYVDEIGKQLLEEKKNIISEAIKSERFIKELNDRKADEKRQEDERSNEITQHVSRLCEVIKKAGDNLIRENGRRTRENIRLLANDIQVLTDKKDQLLSNQEYVDDIICEHAHVTELNESLDKIRKKTKSVRDFNNEYECPNTIAYRFTPEIFEETSLKKFVGKFDSHKHNYLPYIMESEEIPVENCTENMQEIIEKKVSEKFDQLLTGEEGYTWTKSLLINEKGHCLLQAALTSDEGYIFLRRFFMTEYGQSTMVKMIKSDMLYLVEKLLIIHDIQAFITSKENLTTILIRNLLDSDKGKQIICRELSTNERFVGNKIVQGWFKSQQGMQSVRGYLNTSNGQENLRMFYKDVDRGRHLLQFLKETEGQRVLKEYLATQNGKQFLCKALQTIPRDVVDEVLKCSWLKEALHTNTGHEIVKQFLATDVGRAMAKSRLDADRPSYMKEIEVLNSHSLPWLVTNSQKNDKLAIELKLNMDDDGNLKFIKVKFGMVLENVKSCTEFIRLENVVYTFRPGSSYTWNNIIPMTVLDNPKHGYIDAEGFYRLTITWDILEYNVSRSNIEHTPLVDFTTNHCATSTQGSLSSRIFLKPVSRKSYR